MANESQIVKRGYSDMPAVEDHLGMNEKYKGLARFICECETPMTIAINGDWGSGKSSAMKIIQKQLEAITKDSGIRKQIVEFNTWEFSVIDDRAKLVFELMHTLNDRLMELELAAAPEGQKHEQGTAVEKVLSGLMKLGDAAKNVAVTFIDESASLKYLNSAVRALCERSSLDAVPEQPDQISATRLMKLVKEDIERRIDTMVGGLKNPRLFIFVDDLDRLDPRVALELIEGMKNFVSYEHCVFILAVDQSVVEQGLKSKYGADLDDGMAKQFFDKIIQLPFQLPVNSYDLASYVRDLRNTDQDAGDFAELLKKFGIYNPRTIKRSLNMLQMLQCIMDPEGSAQKDQPGLAAKQYAVLLLQLTRKDDHTDMVKQIVAGNPKATKEGFGSLRVKTDDNTEREYIAAVLDKFYQDARDPDEATKQLVEILLYTKSEDVRQENLIPAQFIHRLFQELNESQPEALENNSEWKKIRASTETSLANWHKELRVEYHLKNLQDGGEQKMTITYLPDSQNPSYKAYVSLYAQRFTSEWVNKWYPERFHILDKGEHPSERQDGVFDCYCPNKGRLTVFAGCHRDTEVLFQLMRDCGFLK